MLGDDKSIRSSLAVKHVLGPINVDDMSRAVQDRCGAGHLRVDASSKSLHSHRPSDLDVDVHLSTAGAFAIAEDARPRVINVDFPALPVGAGSSLKLIENGTRNIPSCPFERS